MTPRDHAAALVGYFTARLANHADPVLSENLRVATEWLRLIDAQDPAVEDIEALVANVEKLELTGSATIDLKLGVRAWAPRARRKAIMRGKG